MVAADDVVIRLLEIDAEEAIFDQVILDDIEVAAYLDAAVDVVMRISGVGQM